MTSLRTIAALAGVGLLAACSNSMNSPPSQADLPVRGALPPSANDDNARALQSSAPLRNSDNKPIDSRTGLNSDPNNPNGAPGYPLK
jgi:hypothetical protein